MDHLEMETTTKPEVQLTHAEKMNARFEAFKAETARMNRSYWASVRRAEQRSKEIRASYTAVYQCPQCGLFRPADHSKGCTDLRPTDISMQEKLDRQDDPMNDRTWDYDVDPHKIAEL
jgi:hypothetical protein